MEIDRKSLLVLVSGHEVLGDVEEKLRAEGLSLGFSSNANHVQPPTWSGHTLAEWIALGGPGARDLFQDPASQSVAGFEATLADGRRLTVRPSPRRAVGPDLFPLLWGQKGRFGIVQTAWLLVTKLDARTPTTAPCLFDRDPEVSAEEAELLDEIAHALAR